VCGRLLFLAFVIGDDEKKYFNVYVEKQAIVIDFANEGSDKKKHYVILCFYAIRQPTFYFQWEPQLNIFIVII
jgi:hypothetical protein